MLWDPWNLQKQNERMLFVLLLRWRLFQCAFHFMAVNDSTMRVTVRFTPASLSLALRFPYPHRMQYDSSKPVVPDEVIQVVCKT